MAPLSPNSSGLWQSFVLGSPETDASEYSSTDAGDRYAPYSAVSPHRIYRQASEKSSDTSHTLPTNPKRIIICCDGTWQSSVNGRRDIPSNVTRLARSIARTGTIKRDGKDIDCQQVVFYSAGVGSSGGVSLVENVRQSVFGDGLVCEVIKAYNFIVTNYAEGDEILCFGFSRGAYTARSVAGLVTDIGIIKPREMDDFPDLYDIYRSYVHEESANFRQSKQYREWITGTRENGEWTRRPHTLPPDLSRVVEVVGVFDTVGALGIPGLVHVQKALNFVAQYVPYSGIDYQGFHNTSMSPYIKNAFHALALDEHIKPFTPTLWRLPEVDEQRSQGYGSLPEEDFVEEFKRLIDSGVSATEQQLSTAWKNLIKAQVTDQLKDIKPALQQVWFPGGHVNIGGGNSTMLENFSYDFEQIALITFTWMCDQITPYISLDNETSTQKPMVFSSLADREIVLRNDLIRRAKQKRESGFLWSLRPLWRRLLDTEHTPSATIDNGQSADSWATGPIIDIFDILKTFIFLHLVVFFLKLIPFMSSYRTPGQYKDKTHKGASITNEMIHPSVYYRRCQLVEYNPESLRDFSRTKRMKRKDKKVLQMYEWKKGEVVVPEYVIKQTDYISRHLIEHSSARSFMAPLMERDEL